EVPGRVVETVLFPILGLEGDFRLAQELEEGEAGHRVDRFHASVLLDEEVFKGVDGLLRPGNVIREGALRQFAGGEGGRQEQAGQNRKPGGKGGEILHDGFDEEAVTRRRERTVKFTSMTRKWMPRPRPDTTRDQRGHWSAGLLATANWENISSPGWEPAGPKDSWKKV